MPREIVKLNFFWLKLPNADYLLCNCMFHFGLSYDKKSLVSVSVETQNFETIFFFVFTLMEKIQFHTMEKMLIIQFHL